LGAALERPHSKASVNIYGGPTLDAPHALQKVIDSVR
jgi:hypothetical protein